MNAIAVIPARGGSKRIPNKNLASIAGEPMIVHSIRIAMQSNVFENVIVSTDDHAIAEISKAHGACVMERTPALSGDNVPILPVIQDVIRRYSDSEYDYLCLLLPTAIFLNSKTVMDARDTLEKQPSLDYVITVEEFSSSPWRALRLSDDQTVEMLHPENQNTRSQDLEPQYHDAGQMSFGKKSSWLEGKHSFESNTKAIVLPKYKSIDIDTLEDLAFAKTLFELQGNV